MDRVRRTWQNPMNSFRPKQWAGGSRRHDSSEIMHQQSKVRMIRSKQAGPSLFDNHAGLKSSRRARSVEPKHQNRS